MEKLQESSNSAEKITQKDISRKIESIEKKFGIKDITVTSMPNEERLWKVSSFRSMDEYAKFVMKGLSAIEKVLEDLGQEEFKNEHPLDELTEESYEWLMKEIENDKENNREQIFKNLQIEMFRFDHNNMLDTGIFLYWKDSPYGNDRVNTRGRDIQYDLKEAILNLKNREPSYRNLKKEIETLRKKYNLPELFKISEDHPFKYIDIEYYKSSVAYEEIEKDFPVFTKAIDRFIKKYGKKAFKKLAFNIEKFGIGIYNIENRYLNASIQTTIPSDTPGHGIEIHLGNENYVMKKLKEVSNVEPEEWGE